MPRSGHKKMQSSRYDPTNFPKSPSVIRRRLASLCPLVQLQTFGDLQQARGQKSGRWRTSLPHLPNSPARPCPRTYPTPLLLNLQPELLSKTPGPIPLTRSRQTKEETQDPKVARSETVQLPSNGNPSAMELSKRESGHDAAWHVSLQSST